MIQFLKVKDTSYSSQNMFYQNIAAQNLPKMNLGTNKNLIMTNEIFSVYQCSATLTQEMQCHK